MMPLQLHLVAVRIGLLFAATQQSSPRECLLTPEGHEYRGHVNITMSGRTCQNWSSQKPHQHPKCVGQESTVNYCRNNISEHLVCVESRPWCYTTDANKRWELCKIPLCNELETTTAPDLLDRNMMHMSGYRDDYNVYDVTDLNNATCQQVTATESNKAFRLKIELSNPVHSRLTVTAVLDEGDCLDFPATMVYTKGDQSVMRPYHNNPSFCDNTPGRCVFECDCSATSCQNVYLVILSAPDHSRKLCEIFIV